MISRFSEFINCKFENQKFDFAIANLCSFSSYSCIINELWFMWTPMRKNIRWQRLRRAADFILEQGHRCHRGCRSVVPQHPLSQEEPRLLARVQESWTHRLILRSSVRQCFPLGLEQIPRLFTRCFRLDTQIKISHLSPIIYRHRAEIIHNETRISKK